MKPATAGKLTMVDTCASKDKINTWMAQAIAFVCENYSLEGYEARADVRTFMEGKEYAIALIKPGFTGDIWDLPNYPIQCEPRIFYFTWNGIKGGMCFDYKFTFA